MNGQETEIKFYVGNLGKIETRLIALGAALIQLRVHETNLRFDTPDQTLRKEGKVLRLRMDTTPKMTFKGLGNAKDGVISRKEIEFEIADFAAGRELIESLGYEVIFFYEKYRRTYELNGSHIMLDELPYGDFVEIEGESSESIQRVSRKIGFQWEAGIASSYSALFEHVATSRGLDTSKLTFEAFSGKRPEAKELLVDIAD